MKKYLGLSLKIVISFVLLTYLFLTYDLSNLLKLMSFANPYYLILGIIFILINYFFSSMRWYYLVLSDRPNLIYMIKLYLVGTFFNNFLPTSIGGDAYKIYKLGDKISSKTDAFTATFLERFIGMFALIIISLYGFLTYSNIDILSFIFIFVLGITLFILFMVFYPKFKYKPEKLLKFFDILDKIHASFLRYRHHKSLIFLSLMASFVVQISAVLTQYYVFKSLGIEIPLNFAFFSFPLIFLSGYAIPSINSLGSQEILYTTFFISLGIPVSLIVSASFLYHFIRLLVSMLGAYFYVNDKEYVKK